MKISNKGVIGLMMTLLLVALSSVGCRSTPKADPSYAWTLNITNTFGGSITVDLIGATERENAVLEKWSFNDYWKPGSQVRKDWGKYALTKSFEKKELWTVKPDNLKWSDWKKRRVTKIWVLAEQKSDVWKLPVSLDEKDWSLERKSWFAKEKKLEIEVQDTMIRVMTPQRN